MNQMQWKVSSKRLTTWEIRTIFFGSFIDSPKVIGADPNHIYFTDDWFEENYFLERGGGKNTGAYNLEDGSIESFYPELSLSRSCPPTWVIPSL